MMRKLAWCQVVLTAVASLFVACSAAPPPAPIKPPAFAAPQLPRGPLPAAPWVATPCTNSTLPPGDLACVAGRPITRADFDRAWAAAEPGTTAPALLQALIDEELLAQAAAKKGLWASAVVGDAQRRAMAGEALERAMAKVTPETIAPADMQKAYRFPQIIVRYDHVDAWFVIDGQMLCCTGDAKQCSQRDEVRTCIEETGPRAKAVYAALMADPPQSSTELFARLKILGETRPDLGAAPVHFYYDKTKHYEEQKGYDVMIKEFAEAVVTMQPGQIHEPVRSAFGWHIPYLERIEPAVHKPWNDPEVRAEISRNILTPIREREAQRYVFELHRQQGVELFFDRLDAPAASGDAAEP
jgi:hypothetical protein